LALAAATVWEVRTTGSDTLCSGGFVAGATGTDYSQQDAAQYTGTDLAVDATTNTKVTSAAHSFVAADVGNLIQVTAGAGFTAGFYQIVSVAGGAATLDRSPAAVSTAGGTYAVGGALATIGKATAAGVATASNKVFVKAGAGYTTTATITVAGTGVTPLNTAPPSRLIGYATTRGDGGQVTITLSTNTGLTALNVTTNAWHVENFVINCASLGTSTGIASSGSYAALRNCKVSNFTVYGVRITGASPVVADCEVTGGTAAATAALSVSVAPAFVVRNYVHDNACVGILLGGASVAVHNLVANNTGAASDGIQAANTCVVYGNTVYGSGRHGVYKSDPYAIPTAVRNNLLASNGGYGLQMANAAGLPAHPLYDGNAYWNNALGARNFSDDTTVNPQDAVAPYTNALDVILTGNPFTNAAGGDFTLNNAAGAGAACRAAGTPGALPGVSQTGKLDLGVFQHADAAGGGLLTGPGMSGGARG
jgi:hypothetical protein